ncbi:uncharacterized protein LOC124638499 [Helicoverpa zea]|uniref:uncharacterized protein LOC124638499 n=1 Tax=Helicoverpa zea TaxID=7113 RepID=UPI001F590370|nr:uncharacterized protein LOC124638499 [Helicoverpa zea]
MTISLLIHCALAEIILAYNSVPEFGNGIFDPVMSSSETSDSYLANDMVVPLLREQKAPIVVQELYDGYLFDDKKCIQFNKRILCGYDKNNGDRLDDYEMIDIGDGCRMRGDRIECGYERKVLRLRKTLVRKAPTRTSMPTTPRFVLENKIKMDILEKMLLKSGLVLIKSVDTASIPTVTESVPETLDSETIMPRLSSHETSSPNTPNTSTDIPIESRLPALPQSTMLSPESTSEITTVSDDEITSTASTNNISSEAITKTVSLGEVSDHETDEPAVQNTTILTKILTTLPELVTESYLDITGLLREQSAINATIRRSDLANNTSDNKINTTCVEKSDRIVCYYFKKEQSMKK